MNTEILAVGTELLLGQIANTNAQRISRALAAAGVDVFRHTVVGDNIPRIAEAVEEACRRADALIITGGLGPTPDDVTSEAVARAVDRSLVRNHEMEQSIRAIFSGRNREMPEVNLKQADLPEGAVAIAPEGTAPGFVVEHSGCVIAALPGVPWEMEAMLTKTVVPLLRERAGDAAIVSREVVVTGLGESDVLSKISGIVEEQTNPTIAFLAGGGVVRVRVTAKAAREADALGLIRPVEEALRARLGDDALPGNPGGVAGALAEMLRTRGASIAVAESLTGGLIGDMLTTAGGASDYFLGSLVCYATQAKRDVAGIDESILQGPGPVSEEAALALAEAAVQKFSADLGISATGVAGPAEQDGKPVGTVWVGATFAGSSEARRIMARGDRDNIRRMAANAALDLGLRLLAARDPDAPAPNA